MCAGELERAIRHVPGKNRSGLAVLHNALTSHEGQSVKQSGRGRQCCSSPAYEATSGRSLLDGPAGSRGSNEGRPCMPHVSRVRSDAQALRARARFFPFSALSLSLSLSLRRTLGCQQRFWLSLPPAGVRSASLQPPLGLAQHRATGHHMVRGAHNKPSIHMISRPMGAAGQAVSQSSRQAAPWLGSIRLDCTSVSALGGGRTSRRSGKLRAARSKTPWSDYDAHCTMHDAYGGGCVSWAPSRRDCSSNSERRAGSSGACCCGPRPVMLTQDATKEQE